MQKRNECNIMENDNIMKKMRIMIIISCAERMKEKK